MSVKERLKDYIKSKGLTIKAFENSINASNGYVNSISKGIGKEYLEIIREKYPDLDLEKLLYSDKIENLEKKDSKTALFKNDLFKSIPFYDINVSAGDIVFLDGGLLKDKEPDDWFDIPKSVDADIAFPTYGHSMSPVITNGDRVAYKFITDWSFFNYFK